MHEQAPPPAHQVFAPGKPPQLDLQPLPGTHSWQVRSLEAALAAPTIPPETVTALLNLAEFMEHDDKRLPLDTRTLGGWAGGWAGVCGTRAALRRAGGPGRRPAPSGWYQASCRGPVQRYLPRPLRPLLPHARRAILPSPPPPIP
jgi:hypothetical protein